MLFRSTTAGTLLVSNSANAITASSTPTIGIAGTTAGTIAFANATSGSITLSPTTGALGSSTITMPATTGTMTVLGNSTTGSGNIVLATSPSLTTPSLGAATASSVAINGVTLGTNKLAATGTSYFNGQTFVGETDTAISLAGVSNSYLNIYGTGGGARMSISRFSGNSSGAAIFTGKSRSTSVGSYVAVQSGDTLADFRFAGDDGSNLATYPVQIQAIVTGAVSAGAIPSALTFGTAASGNATERMRIDSAGFVGIGTVPYNILDIYKPQNASDRKSTRLNSSH